MTSIYVFKVICYVRLDGRIAIVFGQNLMKIVSEIFNVFFSFSN